MAFKARYKFWIEVGPAIAIYVTLCAIWFPEFMSHLNPDGISYLSIAQKYWRQDYSNAVNGYWSPLLSWLLLPFLLAKFEPFWSIRILLIIIGGVCLMATGRLAAVFGLYGMKRFVCVTTLAVPMMYWSMLEITPDILLSCFILLYWSVIFDHVYASKKVGGILCGILGALSYFAKAYAFPFFLVHFSVLNAVHYAGNKRAVVKRGIVRHAVFGGMVFVVVCSLWIYQLSIKYGFVTPGTAGDCNYAWANAADQYHQNKLLISGLISPPNDTAASFWEDPSFSPRTVLNPSGSSWSIKKQMLIIIKNFYDLILYCQKFSIFSIAIVLGAIIFLKNDRKFVSPFFICLLTIVIYASGYLVIWLAYRHAYPVYILLLLSGFRLIQEVERIPGYFRKQRKYVLYFFLTLSVMFDPVKFLIKPNDGGNEIALIASKLEYVIPKAERIASNTNWGETLTIAFLNGYSFFGMPLQRDSIFSNPELKRHEISYYLEWTGLKIDPYSDVTINQNGQTSVIFSGPDPVLKIHALCLLNRF